MVPSLKTVKTGQLVAHMWRIKTSTVDQGVTCKWGSHLKYQSELEDFDGLDSFDGFDGLDGLDSFDGFDASVEFLASFFFSLPE